jgi:phosphate acetyltransferase
VSAPSFIETVRERAARRRRRIAFPESSDGRVLRAVTALSADGIVDPVMVLDSGAGRAPNSIPSHLEVIDPATDPRREEVMAHILTVRAHRGLSVADADALSRQALYFADHLVANREVDGCVAGCVLTTAEVLRAALWLVGSASGIRTVSSAFYMIATAFRSDATEVVTFTDCAVVTEPTSEQLADIAISAAADRRRIVGDAPCVAFLSYSTLGSGSGASVERVRAALSMLRERQPDLMADGEMQGDAALIPSVGEGKASGSLVAGRANVLVFPSLDAGNIAYKLVERMGHARAVGPVVQGLARPCNDLSRGASADDIMNVSAITALQAGAGGA